MKNLYTRIIKHLADEHINDAFKEGHYFGVKAGKSEERREIIKRLESLEIEKFKDTGVTLGYNTALELIKEESK